MNRPVRAALFVVLVALAGLSFPTLAAADVRSEAGAQDALKKAEGDFLGTNFGAGATRLQKALKACGTVKCTPSTRAALLRDIGVMQFRKGNKVGANKLWASALKLAPGLAPNPAYEAKDLQTAYEAAGGGAVAGGGGSGGSGVIAAIAGGIFSHTPATEQKVNTPLPVYVEGGGAKVVQVTVRYKGAAMSEWRRVDLDKVGAGWGGLIPCSDVTAGTLPVLRPRGFNSKKKAVANSGIPITRTPCPSRTRSLAKRLRCLE